MPQETTIELVTIGHEPTAVADLPRLQFYSEFEALLSDEHEPSEKGYQRARALFGKLRAMMITEASPRITRNAPMFPYMTCNIAVHTIDYNGDEDSILRNREKPVTAEEQESERLGFIAKVVELYVSIANPCPQGLASIEERRPKRPEASLLSDAAKLDKAQELVVRAIGLVAAITGHIPEETMVSLKGLIHQLLMAAHAIDPVALQQSEHQAAIIELFPEQAATWRLAVNG